VAAARAAGPFIAQIPVAVPARFDLLAPAILLAVAVAALSSIYPAVRAAKLDPAEALRFI